MGRTAAAAPLRRSVLSLAPPSAPRARARLLQMRLVAVDEEEGEALPLEYDPALIEEYWGRRPVAVATRVIQLLSISSGARLQ